MIKKIMLATSLSLIALSGSAYILTPGQALDRALQRSETDIRTMSINAEPRLAMTVTRQAGAEAAAYVFVNDPVTGRGFVVVSASDKTAPILGYSENGAFDKDNLPPGFVEWMQGYAREISDIEKGVRTVFRKVIPRVAADRTAIAPMVQTKWNQSEPYNDVCPLINGRPSMTGCMATAEAQVLNYFQYPKKLRGHVSYTTTTYREKIDVEMSAIALEWDKMLNIYDKDSPEASNKAVADLMFACGVASAMDYTPSASGATSTNSVRGMYDYFSCIDAGMLFADWMTFDDLESYVYDYLKTKGPLLYCGQSQSGGHAFVCDGYRTDGFFHFNWGWGGMSDGYFRLNALNPGSQGIGGSNSGYNSSQQLIPGLHAPVERNKFIPVCAADGGSKISEDWNTVLGDTVLIEGAIEDGGFWNFSADTINVTFGARFTRNATGESTYMECYGIKKYRLPYLRGWKSYPIVIPKNLAEGTYTIVPTYKNGDTEWRDFFISQSYRTSTLATVEGDSIKFEAPKPADISISNIKFETPCYAGGGFVLTAEAIATGDRNFYGNVALVLGEYYGEDFVSDFQASSMTIGANTENATEFRYVADFSNTRLKGEYQLVFVNVETGVILSEPFKVKITPYPGEAVPEAVKTEIENAHAVNPYNVMVKADILSRTGYFSQPLYLSLGTLEGEKFTLLNRVTSQILYIEPNRTQTVTFGGALAGQEGEMFVARLEYYNAKTRKYIQMGEDMPFKIGVSGVDVIETEDTDAPVRFFDLNGREVDPEAMTPGVYVRKQGAKVDKVVIR